MKDKIMWALMVGIMILGIIIAGNYFSSLRDVARFSTISRELALIDNADNRLNILFDAKIARRDFSIANADMRGIYQVLQALQKDKIIDKIGLSSDVRAIGSAFSDKISLLDELGALNSQNLILFQSLQQKFLSSGANAQRANLYS